MSCVRSFGPVAGRGARLLILGSMPGAASLAAGRYYAHPANSFWRILLAALAGGRTLSYPARLRLLEKSRIALWDVLASCVRPGSSDSAIKRSSMRVNDIRGLLARQPGINRIVFNGSKAEECFRRLVLPGLGPRAGRLELLRLPSTSPAHASVTFAAKLRAWRKALRAAGRKPAGP